MFDIYDLREKGFSDDEIIGALKLNYGESFDFAKAKDSGISSSELVEYFGAKKNHTQTQKEQIPQKEESKTSFISQNPSILEESSSPLQNTQAQKELKEDSLISPQTPKAQTQVPLKNNKNLSSQSGTKDNYFQAGELILKEIGLDFGKTEEIPKEPQESEMGDSFAAPTDAIPHAKPTFTQKAEKFAKEVARDVGGFFSHTPARADGGEYAKLSSALASYKYNQDGAFALAPLLDSKESREVKQKALDDFFIKRAQEAGLTPKIGIKEGERRYGIVEKNGTIKDITPGFLQMMEKSFGEMVGSLAGLALSSTPQGAGANLAVQGASKALPALSRALGSNYGKAFAFGALGSGAGAVSDDIRNKLEIGENPNALSSIKAFSGGMANEALGVGVAEAIIKGVPKIYHAIKQTEKLTGKIIDISPIAGAIRTQNINGAMRELEKQVGGKDKLEKILFLSEKLGTTLQSEGKSESLAIAKDLLTEKGANSNNKWIKSGTEKTKKALERLDDFLLSDKITEGQSKILTLSRANPRLAQMLSNIVESDSVAAKNLKNIITKDTEKIFYYLEALRGDSLGLRGAAKEYVINTKRAFSDMLKTLENTYGEASASIGTSVKFDDFLQDMQSIAQEAWASNIPHRLKEAWQSVTLNKELKIKDINKLRIELNRVIENSNFFEARAAAKRTKEFLENDVLEDILEQLPLKHEAKELYKTSVAEYKAMKGIEESRWYKNRVENPDVGDEAVINKALKVFLESSENSSGKNSSISELLARISPKNRAGIELEFIERVLKRSELEGEEVRALDLQEALSVLKNVQFQSDEARGFNELLGELSRIIGNDSTIAQKLGGFRAQEKLSQGISQDPLARLATQKANFIVKNAFRLFPIIGDQSALLHHLGIAAKNAKSYTGFKAHLEHIAKSPDIERGIRANINSFLRSARELEGEAKRAEIEYKRGGNNNNNGGASPKGGGGDDGGRGGNPSGNKGGDDEGSRNNGGLSPSGNLSVFEANREVPNPSAGIFSNELKNLSHKASQSVIPTQSTPKIPNNRGVLEGKRLNDGEIEAVISALKNDMQALRLTPNADVLGVAREFSKPIKTPIFEAKIELDKLLNHLSTKEDAERRIEYINLIKPTLETPLFITKEGERYRFFKHFFDERDRSIKFLSVIEEENRDGVRKFVGITATPLKNTDVRNLLKEKVIWGGDIPASLGTPQTVKGLDTKTIVAQKTQKADTTPNFNEPKIPSSKEAIVENAPALSETEYAGGLKRSEVAASDILRGGEVSKPSLLQIDTAHQDFGKSSSEIIAQKKTKESTLPIKQEEEPNTSTLEAKKEVNTAPLKEEQNTTKQTKPKEEITKTPPKEAQKAQEEAQESITIPAKKLEDFFYSQKHASLKTRRGVEERLNRALSKYITENFGNKDYFHTYNLRAADVPKLEKRLQELNQLLERAEGIDPDKLRIKGEFSRDKEFAKAIIVEKIKDYKKALSALIEHRKRAQVVEIERKKEESARILKADEELKALLASDEEIISYDLLHVSNEGLKQLEESGKSLRLDNLRNLSFLQEGVIIPSALLKKHSPKEAESIIRYTMNSVDSHFFDEASKRVHSFGESHEVISRLEGKSAIVEEIREIPKQAKEKMGQGEPLYRFTEEFKEAQSKGIREILRFHFNTDEALQKRNLLRFTMLDYAKRFKLADPFALLVDAAESIEGHNLKHIKAAYAYQKELKELLENTEREEGAFKKLLEEMKEEMLATLSQSVEAFEGKHASVLKQSLESVPKNPREKADSAPDIERIDEFLYSYYLEVKDFYARQRDPESIRRIALNDTALIVKEYLEKNIREDFITLLPRINEAPLPIAELEEMKHKFQYILKHARAIKPEKLHQEHGVELKQRLLNTLKNADKKIKERLATLQKTEKSTPPIKQEEAPKEAFKEVPNTPTLEAKEVNTAPLKEEPSKIDAPNPKYIGENRERPNNIGGFSSIALELEDRYFRGRKIPEYSHLYAYFNSNGTFVPKIPQSESAPHKAITTFGDYLSFLAGIDTTTEMLRTGKLKGEKLQNARKVLQDALGIKPISGIENFPEYYRAGSKAVEALLRERRGQVAGAFYRDDLGDIDLLWGSAGSGKSDGYGLSKIEKYHPEVIDKLHHLIESLPLAKESNNRIQLIDENYVVSIRKEFDGQKGNWILTAFEKRENATKRRTDLSSEEAKKTTLANTTPSIKPPHSEFQPSSDLGQNGNYLSASDAVKTGITKPKESDHPSAIVAQKESEDIAKAQEVPLKEGIFEDMNQNYHRDTPREYGGEKSRFEENLKALDILKKKPHPNTPHTKEEQEILAHYNGWGGLAKYFEPSHPQNARLREILGDYYQSALESTTDSFYTPQNIIKSIWEKLEESAFKGGEVLEPSLGIGNFFALMPQNIAKSSKLYGVELDEITSNIARRLYPKAFIKQGDFREFKLKGGADLVVANPPYGDLRVREAKAPHLHGQYIHNYFTLKSLDLTRENGINVIVATSKLMDSSNIRFKKALSERAELLGAVRLPDNAFKDTSVTTDILFLRKKQAGEARDTWLEQAPVTITGDDGNLIAIHPYFSKHKEQILGDIGLYSGMYGGSVGVKLKSGNLNELLKEALGRIKLEIKEGLKPLEGANLASAHQKTTLPYLRQGSIFHDNGRIYRQEGEGVIEISGYELLNLPKSIDEYSPRTLKSLENRAKKAKEIISSIEPLRESLFTLKRLELDTKASEATINSERERLNKLYDEFVKKYGYLSEGEIARIYEGDSTYAHLSALEKNYKSFNKEGKRITKAQKADIFTKRTLYPYIEPKSAKDTKEAIQISLSQKGALEIPYMANLLKKAPQFLEKELLERKEVFKDEQGALVLRDEFLSGDIAKKINELEGVEADSYQKESLKALQEILPKRLEIDDISFSLGSPWIPKEVYKRFEREVLEAQGNSSYTTQGGWSADFYTSYKINNEFGVTGRHKQASASDIYEAALNNRHFSMSVNKDGVRHSDIHGDTEVSRVIERLKGRFLEFVLSDGALSELVSKEYNRRFNTFVDRKFSGGETRLRDQSNLIELKPHQASAIRRIIATPNTLLDHTVGTGKSFTMIGAAMELRRLGIAKKPLIVVPKALLAQTRGEFIKLFPNANILSPYQFDAKNRQKVLASIATNDYDAIILTHENFEKISIKPEFEKSMIKKEISKLEEALKEKKNAKRLALMLKKAKERLSALNHGGKSKDEIFFEDLGVDALFVDEAHAFKNLRFFTNMQKVKGLGNIQGSQRANDMYNKVRLIQQKGGKIIFATGTPLTNSVLELYTLQRYLAPQRLEALGIRSSDEWIAANARILNGFEPNVAGGFSEVSTLKELGNVQEIYREYRGFADVVTNKSMGEQLEKIGRGKILPPEVEIENIYLEPSSETKAHYFELMRRDEELSKNPKLEGDHKFKIFHEAKLAALDMRLINPNYSDFAGSKASILTQKVADVYKKTQEAKGAQLIFLDSSTPKKSNSTKGTQDLEELGEEEALELSEMSNFNLYDDLKKKLITKGVKEEDIVFIHDYDTPKKREDLSRAINEGEVRVVLGSTKKLGIGLNIQERLAAIHEFDIPITPDIMLQRRGRIERGGNMIGELIKGYKPKIFTYITRQSSDIYQLNALARKAKVSDDLRTGNLKGRRLEGEDSFSEQMGETFIIATGSNDLKRKAELERLIRTLESEEVSYLNATRRKLHEIKMIKDSIETLPQRIIEIKEDMKSLSLGNKSDELITINNHLFSKKEREEALNALLANIHKKEIGSFKGFKIESFKEGEKIWLVLEGNGAYELAPLKIQELSGGIFTRLENLLKNLPEQLKRREEELVFAKKRFKELESSTPSFSKKQELEKAREELGEVIARLKESREHQEVILNANALVLAPLLGFIPTGEDEFILENQSSVLVLLGLGLGALAGQKMSGERLKKLASALPKGALESLARVLKQKEKRGIYNVTFNGKRSTPIYKDLESVEVALMYDKGTRDRGAKHIRITHLLDSNKKGYVKKEELLNIGENMRSFQEKHGEPFIDKNGARIYEWSKDGVRFRTVVSEISGTDSTPASAKDQIITFYSDRNLKKPMEFKNPKLKEHQ